MMTRSGDEGLDARGEAMRTIIAALIVSLADLWSVSMVVGQQPAALPSVTTSSERPWWNGGFFRQPSENPDARKLALGYAHDLELTLLQAEPAADDSGIAAEPALPVRIADDGDR